jgi:hypothetical protein
MYCRFHPGFKGSLHSKDVASVGEPLKHFSHMYYLCFQLEVSFVTSLGMLHQLCVHGGAVQLLTAVPQVTLTHALAGHSDCLQGWKFVSLKAEAAAASRRSGTLSLQHAGSPKMGTWEKVQCC